ncbi:LysR family transcriptional regulator [uncultured Thalassolituus sp.]|uniref:LysR family transcriptional regulator n=1 Tax=uncultured Thalassolituus sp. TaxID=285273 RepID=UPI00262692D1|nr:LysR family transcriptional regulator [uncultured Thalassolituus sp.]
MLDIRHLKTLTALRDSGSMVEAARRLYLTQSALSHQLKDLEEKLGTSLFERKSRPVRFTRAGLEVLQLADRVLPLVNQTERTLKKIQSGQEGRLHMAIECHSCFEWLMPAINQFRDHWPEVELDLSTSFHFEPMPALLRGDIDLVITSDPAPGQDIRHIPLFRYQSVLALANQHPLATESWILPQQLSEETLIHYPVDRKRLDIFEYFLNAAGIEPLATRQTELTLMMVQLVASGRGVACLPSWALHQYLEAGLITSRPLGEHGVWPTLYAAVREDQAEAHFLQDFIRIATDSCFSTLPGIIRPGP